MAIVPSTWKVCATCRYWCGIRNPDVFCKNIEFLENNKGRCAGGGFNNAQMAPRQTCSKWSQQYR